MSEEAQLAQEILQTMLTNMDFPASVEVTETPEQITLDMVSDQPMGLLIGKNGQTLNAIELLVKTIAQQKMHGFHKYLLVDAEGYRQRHATRLNEMAREAAEQAMQTGEAASLPPMSARDRRTVHMAIAEIDGVASYSAGEEPYRHVVVCLPDQVPEGAEA